MRCRPPRGVMVIKVGSNSPYWLISFASAAVPSMLRTGSRSTSTTHILLADPVGAAIMALGHRVLETAFDQRLFVEWVGGEYGNPLLAIAERGIDFVGRAGLRLGGHDVILPPSLK